MVDIANFIYQKKAGSYTAKILCAKNSIDVENSLSYPEGIIINSVLQNEGNNRICIFPKIYLSKTF